jgi:hypothetical protein
MNSRSSTSTSPFRKDGSKNLQKMDPNRCKNQMSGAASGFLGDLMAPRCPKMRFGSRLGLHFHSFWALPGPQDEPRQRQDRRREPQVGTKMGQLGRKTANLTPRLDHFSVSWGWPFKKGRGVKTNNPLSVLMVFWRFGCLRRVLEVILGGFSELCWTMLAARWCFSGYLGLCYGILEPRWANRSPGERILEDLGGSAGAQDGRAHPELVVCKARGLGGVVRSPKDLESKDQRIQKVKLKGSKDERSKDSYKDSRY